MSHGDWRCQQSNVTGRGPGSDSDSDPDRLPVDKTPATSESNSESESLTQSRSGPLRVTVTGNPAAPGPPCTETCETMLSVTGCGTATGCQ